MKNQMESEKNHTASSQLIFETNCKHLLDTDSCVTSDRFYLCCVRISKY